MRPSTTVFVALAVLLPTAGPLRGDDVRIVDGDLELRIETPLLQAAVRKKGYVTGIYRQTFLDKTTGFRDAGFGLDIVDWIMEPGSDKAYRDRLDPELVYRYDNMVHGKRAKRSLEGPQICTKARRLDPRLLRGKDFVAVGQRFQYTIAAPGRKSGSTWSQWMVFPNDTRYFFSMDRIEAAGSSDAMFLRIDMPGHIRHKRGDSFEQVYLSYLDKTNDSGGYKEGLIPSSAFFEDFPPDERFNYRRDRVKTLPERFIRAYRLRDPETGKVGPWLAGMTLDPSVVHEAWCHQRGYVCMIEEFGGGPIQPGESFSAAFIVGYFDSIEEMHAVYDRYRGHTGLEVAEDGWRLLK